MPDYRHLRAWQLARDVAVQSRPYEVAVVLDLVVALGYFKESDLVSLRRVRDECARTVWGLLRSIAARNSPTS